MNKLNLLALISVLSLLFSGKVIGAEIQTELNISLAPTVLKPEQWAVLTIVQILDSASNEAVDLNDKSLEGRALFAKKTDVSGWVDKERRWALRVQVYLIKPMDSRSLELKKSDFKNIKSNALNPLNISIE